MGELRTEGRHEEAEALLAKGRTLREEASALSFLNELDARAVGELCTEGRHEEASALLAKGRTLRGQAGASSIFNRGGCEADIAAAKVADALAFLKAIKGEKPAMLPGQAERIVAVATKLHSSKEEAEQNLLIRTLTAALHEHEMTHLEVALRARSQSAVQRAMEQGIIMAKLKKPYYNGGALGTKCFRFGNTVGGGKQSVFYTEEEAMLARELARRSKLGNACK